jgi:hypothetical protein
LAEDRAVFLAEDQVALPGEPMPLRAMPMAAMPVDAMPAEAMLEATPVGREGRRVRSRRGGRRFAERAPVPVEAEEDHVGGLAEIGLGSLDLIEVEEPVLGVEEPAFEQVLAPEPVVAEPGATEPISAEPIAVGPIAAGPIMAGPNTGDPITAGPITAGPITAEPMVAPVRRRRVDRSDRGYGDRVDGWIRPEYHEEPIEPPSGEYWTPVPMELDLDDVDPEPSAKGYGWPVRVERLPAVPPYEPATGFDLTPVATEPTEVVPSWPPLPGELRRPGVWPAPDGEQEAVDRPDLVVVGDTRADDRLGRRRSRREESARAWARRDEQARAEVWPINPERRARGNARDRTAKDRRADDQVVPVADRGWREEPYQEPERSGDRPAWSDPPAAPPVRRRPRPRPRPHQDVQPGDGNVYQSRHAAEPPR